MTVLRGKADDAPVITMRIEQGRLLPVSAFDLELLQRWREGAILNVEVSPVAVRALEKKYFAMLSHLLKVADTPWSNTESAHEALKLAAGFVTPYRKKSGAWGAHPRHISSFSDAELSEFVEVFCGIVQQRFGIDPETLRAEASDIGTESSGAPANRGAADDGPGARPIPAGVGDHSRGRALAGALGIPLGNGSSPAPADDGPEADGAVESTPRGSPSADGIQINRAELDWLRQTARMLIAATEPGGEMAVLNKQVLAIKTNHTPASISQPAKDIATEIYRHCRAAISGEAALDKAWVAKTARCRTGDLKPEAR